MREIKFRAWNKVKEKMVTDAINNCVDSFDLILKHPQIYEIMQYTELKDRSGTEIYEGDILELISEDGERIKAICKFGNRRLATEDGVTIDIKCFYFQIGDRKTNPVVFNYRGMHDLEIMEVRGNIYEDPELLR